MQEVVKDEMVKFIKKTGVKPKIGLYSVGLHAYWEQFPSLYQRLYGYGEFIFKKMQESADVSYYGVIDSVEKGKDAGEYFNKENVDLIFVHAATYATSSYILPIHQRCTAKVVILNLQPTDQVNYEKTNTEEWLAHCNACPVPEFCNALNRSGIEYEVINGLLGMEKSPDISLTNEITYKHPAAIQAWKEIDEWIQAVKVKQCLADAKFGFLGNTYNGMLDMYSDFTMLQAQTGIQVEVIEMCDLADLVEVVTAEEIEKVKTVAANIFDISESSPSERLAKKPTQEEFNWACKIAIAQKKLVEDFELDALTYYYHGTNNSQYEQIQSGLILGNSLLTANHVPIAGEGDLKTNIAMKICDLMEIGGSFCEIVTADYLDDTIIFGHDGPFHLEISDEKPVLRGMGLYHGKKGSGISVEAKVKKGPVTLLGLTQTNEGKLKFIIAEGESTNGETMRIGNTQTPVKFNLSIDDFYSKLFKEAPTHHCAMSIGHNKNTLQKVGNLMNIDTVVI